MLSTNYRWIKIPKQWNKQNRACSVNRYLPRKNGHLVPTFQCSALWSSNAPRHAGVSSAQCHLVDAQGQSTRKSWHDIQRCHCEAYRCIRNS